MLLPWKRGANEAVGAGWLLRRCFCAPAPSALFAAPAILFTVDLINIDKLCPPECGQPNTVRAKGSIVRAIGRYVRAMRSFIHDKGRYIRAIKSFVCAKRSFIRAKGKYVRAKRSFVRAKGSFIGAEPNIVPNEASIVLAETKNTLSAGYLHKLLCRSGLVFTISKLKFAYLFVLGA